MAINIGLSAIADLRVGDEAIDKAYIGDELIWASGPVSGFLISQDSSLNLSADISSNPTLSNADYVIYDWRKTSGDSKYSIYNVPLTELTLSDYSSNAYDLTDTVPKGTSGGPLYDGRYANFGTNAAEKIITQLANSDLVNSTQASVEFWIYRAVGTGGHGIAAAYGANIYPEFGVNIRAGRLHYGNSNERLGFTASQTEGEWLHFCFVYDSTLASEADRYQYYINSAPGGYKNTPNYPDLNQVISTSPEKWLMGGVTVYALNAKMAGVRTYDVALTQAQIQRCYHKQFDIIDRQQLSNNDEWICYATPVTAGVKGTEEFSNPITVANTVANIPTGLTVYKDTNSNVIADINTEPTLVAADYVVFDWQVSKNSGVSFDSYASLNMPMVDNAFANFTTRTMTITNVGNIQHVTVNGKVYADINKDANVNDKYFATNYPTDPAKGLTVFGNVIFGSGSGARNTRRIATCPTGYLNLNNQNFSMQSHQRSSVVPNASLTSAMTDYTRAYSYASTDNGGLYFEGTTVPANAVAGTINTTNIVIGAENSTTGGYGLRAGLSECIVVEADISATQISFWSDGLFNSLAEEETTTADVWQCRCIPITGGIAGTPVLSNQLVV